MCDLEGISIALSFLFNCLPSVLIGAALIQISKASVVDKAKCDSQVGRGTGLDSQVTSIIINSQFMLCFPEASVTALQTVLWTSSQGCTNQQPQTLFSIKRFYGIFSFLTSILCIISFLAGVSESSPNSSCELTAKY